MQEDVGDLQIAMDHAKTGQIDESLQNISEYRGHLSLCESPLFFGQDVEVPTVAHFGDDEAVMIAVDDVVATDAVGVIKFCEDVEFVAMKFEQFGVFD